MISEKRKKELEAFLSQNNVKVDKYDLINSSLTHPSFIFEKDFPKNQHNQRLEFLGDAVVGLVIAEYLFNSFPEKKEGVLTKMRAAIVCESSLADAARKIHIGKYILMGKGEKMGGGEKRSSNLADAWEALCGAIYLECGLKVAEGFILYSLQEAIENVIKGNFGDFKTRLQELIQKSPEQEIEYQILEENGPDHDKDFVAGVFINGEMMSKGAGKTKKEAEQGAAREALVIMGEID
jgi:ribonuclease-3